MSLQCLSMPRFYRILVGIQSPAGVTTTRGVLRRFNDFLKLFSDLRKAFPKKSLPSAPPKGLLRMKSRALLEERRCSLEEWMLKLLSDIDISRSMVVASFLELEAAARSSFQEAGQQSSDANPSTTSSISSDQNHPSFSLPVLAGSSSITSDYGSDTAYETSDLGSPSFGRDDVSEVGLEELTLDEDLTSPMEKIVKYSMSNIDEGLLMGESILDQLEGFKTLKVQNRHVTENGSALKSVSLAVDRAGSSFEAEPAKVVNHLRKSSNESVGSDLSSYRGGEMSNSWTPNLIREASFDLHNGAEASRTMGSPSSSELQYSVGDIVLPRDQQPKLDRTLMIMQRRLVTAKTDMEDLISRLNQEVAVKEYLTTKVKDLEGELETTKEKSKENLQQALSLEKERITKMQWDMEELRQKSLEFELKLKYQEDAKLPADTMSLAAFPEKDELLQELEATKDKFNILLKQHEELEVKSKSDIKVLVKEVKSLRRSQNELKQKLEGSLQEKSEVEQLLQQEMERSEHALVARRKLLHDCQTLQSQLQECNITFVDNNFVVDSSSISDVLDLLAESDKQIGLLLAETQRLAPETNTLPNFDDVNAMDHELRVVLGEIVSDNANLRKQVNNIIRSALHTDSSTNENNHQTLPRETVLKQLFES
ncbi:PX domain-containing protein EREL1 isoform X2 [Beta vulgaris subsp. vulgaris]|uniref:PX domain-containing protein EREL1 isoform X2 n=1 Tax=Beta vulgaris subsp. vulgaris TaxID=3555 RepID=UPI00054031B6|nr:PX domain-containing protein EREL1 isoform X2 [Beta vulgaris subsp. vulgaris]